MNATEFFAAARANGWNRKAVRNELYKLGEPLWSQRDAILTALGFAPTIVAVAPAKPAVVELPKPLPAQPTRRGNMTLKYAAEDVLTGAMLEPGADVLGVKLGGRWDFTAEEISARDFRKLREAMLLSLGDDEGGPDGQLDHEDYYILAEFGKKYPRVASMIGCAVPGLE